MGLLLPASPWTLLPGAVAPLPPRQQRPLLPTVDMLNEVFFCLSVGCKSVYEVSLHPRYQRQAVFKEEAVQLSACYCVNV
jgi:hypothetical protein